MLPDEIIDEVRGDVAVFFQARQAVARQLLHPPRFGSKPGVEGQAEAMLAITEFLGRQKIPHGFFEEVAQLQILYLVVRGAGGETH